MDESVRHVTKYYALYATQEEINKGSCVSWGATGGGGGGGGCHCKWTCYLTGDVQRGGLALWLPSETAVKKIAD